MGTLQKARVDQDGVHLPQKPEVAAEMLRELGYDADNLVVWRVEADRYVVSDDVNGAYMVIFIHDPTDKTVRIATEQGWAI